MANDQSMPLSLQDTQCELVHEYSQRIFYEGAANYGEIVRAQAMFGRFWKNSVVCEDPFDDLFDAFGETDRTVLVCLSEGILQKNKRECNSGEDIKVQKI